MLQNGIIQQNVNAKILPSLPDLFPVQRRREGANHFLHIFTFSAHFKDITLQLQKLMTKAKQTYKCEVKTFIKHFETQFCIKKILTNQENGGITDQYKSLKGNIRKIYIAYNLNYPHLVDCKIQNFGDICKNFG